MCAGVLTTGMSVSGSLSLVSLSKIVCLPWGSSRVTSSPLVLWTSHSLGVCSSSLAKDCPCSGGRAARPRKRKKCRKGGSKFGAVG